MKYILMVFDEGSESTIIWDTGRGHACGNGVVFGNQQRTREVLRVLKVPASLALQEIDSAHRKKQIARLFSGLKIMERIQILFVCVLKVKS